MRIQKLAQRTTKTLPLLRLMFIWISVVAFFEISLSGHAVHLISDGASFAVAITGALKVLEAKPANLLSFYVT